MKKVFKRISLILFLFFISIGCGNSSSIVGTWKYQNNPNTYYVFNKNATGSYTSNDSVKNFTYEDRGTKVIITFEDNTSSNEFDYSISDGILTIKDSTGSYLTFERK